MGEERRAAIGRPLPGLAVGAAYEAWAAARSQRPGWGEGGWEVVAQGSGGGWWAGCLSFRCGGRGSEGWRS